MSINSELSPSAHHEPSSFHLSTPNPKLGLNPGAMNRYESPRNSANRDSDVDREHVTHVRSGGSEKEYVITSRVVVKARIYPAGESMTFPLTQGQNVVTFAVDCKSLKYDMMVKGAG